MYTQVKTVEKYTILKKLLPTVTDQLYFMAM